MTERLELLILHKISPHNKQIWIFIASIWNTPLTIFITAEGLTATPLKYLGSSFHGFAERNSANFASSKVYRASAAATVVLFVSDIIVVDCYYLVELRLLFYWESLPLATTDLLTYQDEIEFMGRGIKVSNIFRRSSVAGMKSDCSSGESIATSLLNLATLCISPPQNLD